MSSIFDGLRFLQAGDQTIVVEVGDSINTDVNSMVRKINLTIHEANISGVREIVPTYRSLLIYYDALVISSSDLIDQIALIEEKRVSPLAYRQRLINIPTLYGGEYGPDLQFVANHAGLTMEEVIAIHSGTDYLVYMMGFSPGFPYLGGLSSKIATPRLESPRAEIPGGSVGIAENQTVIYPVSSPGGWQLIGSTPLSFFDPYTDPPVIVNPSDTIRFVPLESESEYLRIKNEVGNGLFKVHAEDI